MNPDGDALGSMSALAFLLEQINKTIILYVPNEYPYNYNILRFGKNIKTTFEEEDALDVLVALDCGNEKRVDGYQKFRQAVPCVVNIDHHSDNNMFGDINWIGTYSSVGEMIYIFAEQNNLSLTKDIAACLYVSVYTDTGGFRFPNTNSHSLITAGKLMEYDFNMPETLAAIFERKSLEELRDLGTTLASAEVDLDGAIIWTVQPLAASALSYEAVDFLKTVENVQVALIFKEVEEKKYKVSLRSKGHVDVSSIAAHFGGGGHKGAAGVVMTGDATDVQHQVLDYIKEVINRS